MSYHNSWLIAILTLALIPTAAITQTGVHTVQGSVRDTAGQPIDQVQVLALAAGRTVRTGADGRFRLWGLPRGEERFLFRRLGFNQSEATFIIDTLAHHIDVRLTPVPEELGPIVVRARRTGVYGTVKDVYNRPVAAAEVRVLGAGFAKTDSLGRFSLPDAPPGAFLLTVRKKGYYVVRNSVTLPIGEALQLSMLLAPVPQGLSIGEINRLSGFGGRMDLAWGEHASRRLRCGSGNAMLVPRAELAEYGHAALNLALLAASSARARGFGPHELQQYSLFIDGHTVDGWPLSGIRTVDVEAVEIYRGARLFRQFASVCPLGSIWVWLR